MSCGVGCGRGSDPALLWLWCGPAAAAPMRPLAWEPPHAVGAAQEMAKRQKKKDTFIGVPVVAQWLVNPTRNQEVAGSISGLARGIKDPALPMSCGVDRGHSSDPTLLWLWRRPEAAAPMRPLA